MANPVWINRAGQEFRVAWPTPNGDKSCVFRTIDEARAYANKKVNKRGMVIEDIRVAS